MIARFTIENYGNIDIELNVTYAPKSIEHFTKLIQLGVFDNQKIMRIAYDFVLQITYNAFNEDPRCNYLIDGEFDANGWHNPLLFEKGTVGLGGDGSKIASPSDFFICISDDVHERLDGKFTAIGKIISGYDIVEKIVQVPTKKIVVEGANVDINEPLEPVMILKAELL